MNYRGQKCSFFFTKQEVETGATTDEDFCVVSSYDMDEIAEIGKGDADAREVRILNIIDGIPTTTW